MSDIRPAGGSQSAARSEWIGVRLILDRHPLPLGKFLPVGRTADSGSVARSAAAPERNMGFVGDSLVVDVQKPSVEAIADRDRAPDIGREYAGGQPVFAVVGESDRLVLGGERRDRGDRPEHLLVKGAH